MSNRYALVDDGLVINIIEWDGLTPWAPSGNLEAVEAEPRVSIGWRRQAGAWLAPEEV